MDAHQQPGALDALIQDGLAMQGMGQHLDQLVNESVQDVLGVQLPDVSHGLLPGVSSFELPPMNMDMPGGEGHQNVDAIEASNLHRPPNSGIGDINSEAKYTNQSGAQPQTNQRPRRRAAAAAANFATDVEGSDEDSFEDGDGDPQETGSSGRPAIRGNKRRRGANQTNGNEAQRGGPERRPQHMQGRFSGRLPTKDDERKLADECALMAPLLSEDGSLTTLPTIIRAMATGSVRSYLEKQRDDLTQAHLMLASYEAASGQGGITTLSEQIVAHETEVCLLRAHVTALEQQLSDAGIHPVTRHSDQQQLLPPPQNTATLGTTIQRVSSLPASTIAAAVGGAGIQHALPIQTVMSMPLSAAAATAAPQSVVLHSAPPQVVQTATGQVVQMPSDATILTQPMVMATVQTGAAPGGTTLLRTIPSSAQLIDANGNPTAVTMVQQPATVPAPVVQQASVTGAGVAGDAAGAAASNLNEHAQQLAVTAKLHEAAKTEASVQAQQLAAQAQQHAHASVQAAQQAEELKKTLAVLPDSQQVQQAAATVQNLEARAQAHASITTQVVAQARDMHEKAKAHESEQLKAITQATVLQAHAQSLQVSAQQLEAHQTAPDTAQQVANTIPNLQVAGAPSASGGPIVSGDIVSAPVGTIQDHARLPTTPLSSASGGPNLFAANTTIPTTAVMMQPTAVMPSSAPMQIVMQPSTAPQVPLVHAGVSGDQSAEVAALQQQIAALQAQQAHQQVAAPRPPMPVQVLHTQPHQVTLPHVTSHGAMLNLMQTGSTSLGIDSNSIAQAPLPPDPATAAFPVAATAQLAPSHPAPPVTIQNIALPTTSAELDVPKGLENLLPTSQPLVLESFTMTPTDMMAPVVSLPDGAATATTNTTASLPSGDPQSLPPSLSAHP